MRRLSPWLVLAFAFGGCGPSRTSTQAPQPTPADARADTVLPVSAVDWQHLNPARGDAGPRAATLWGDRNGNVPTGFLVRFVDGFSSPPHIHNVSYRGVVVRGLVHNDDPNADAMWMGTGSFWTQPKGGVHITAAKGAETIAYIEIDGGPYLVRPVAEASSGAEKPLNVDAANLVWLDASRLGWTAPAGSASDGPQVAFLWGRPTRDAASGTLIKLAPGSSTAMRSSGAAFRAVVISGELTHPAAGESTTLAPGSYFSTGGAASVACKGEQACVVYVRSDGGFSLAPAD